MFRRPTSSVRAALIAAVVLGACAPAANGDIIAATGVSSPTVGQRRDIALVDVNTGARLPVPSGVNTSADETVPSITRDGGRMVFLRVDGSTLRVIMVDLSTGQMADLFNGFDVAAHAPRSPSITPDGRTVFTGGRYRDEGNGHFRPYVVGTDVTSFPNGPFAHVDYDQGVSFTHDGFVEQVFAAGSSTGDRIAFQARPAALGDLALDTLTAPPGLQGHFRSPPAGASFSHPTIGSPDGAPTILFDERGGPNDQGADLRFLPVDPASFLGAHAAALSVDTGSDESRPAFTPDSRYVVFVRTGSDSHDRLLAWDSETQTLVNGAGVDLGPALQGDLVAGSPSLYMKPVFTLASVSRFGFVNFNLLTPTPVGILVQRVVGHHTLFGRRVPKLKLVGRVPLGKFKKGKGQVHWNLRVSGRRLPRGTYQVTPRAVTKSGRIRDLGKPKILSIK